MIGTSTAPRAEGVTLNEERMSDVAVVPEFLKAAKAYVRDVGTLIAAGSTTEAAHYLAVKALLAAPLAVEDLPFDVRVNTSEEKPGGGINLPDPVPSVAIVGTPCRRRS